MTGHLRNLCLGSLLALAVILPGRADGADPNRLYSDSTLLVQPRFSDEIIGSGPDLVFIPGLASSRATWKAAAEHLKAHYRLHLIQIAGFAGESVRDNASGPLLQPAAEAIDAYLKAQHLTPATIVGHSLGGTMILCLAETHGEDLKRAMIVDALPFAGVLVGQTTPADAEPIAQSMRAHPQPQPKAMRERMMQTMASAQESRELIGQWSDASDVTAVANAFADDITLDLRPGLATVTAPITLVYPDYAPLGQTAEATTARYVAAYAGAKTVTPVEIANSLHFVMFDQPELFLAALDTFLSQP